MWLSSVGMIELEVSVNVAGSVDVNGSREGSHRSPLEHRSLDRPWHNSVEEH